jgi:hypothetical protein
MESMDWIGQMPSNIRRERNNWILKLEAEDLKQTISPEARL